MLRQLLGLVVLLPGALVHAHCNYTYTDDNGVLWAWDLGALASSGGYEIPYEQSFLSETISSVFHINFCQTAPQACYPEGYVADATGGLVVQSWDQPAPACTQYASGEKYCDQGTATTTNVCCTSPCVVLSSSVTPFHTEPLDPTKLGQPSGDGLLLQFPTITDGNTNRTICETGTPTMEVQYSLYCNSSIEFENVEVLNQGCQYNFVILTKYACAQAVTTRAPTTHHTTTKHAATTTTPNTSTTGMSAGSAFILILFIVAVLYFGVGTLVLYFMTKTWTIPNRTMWVAFWALVTDGFAFLLRGCKKQTASPYVDGEASKATSEGSYVEAGGDSEFSGGDAGAAGEPYDDL